MRVCVCVYLFVYLCAVSMTLFSSMLFLYVRFCCFVVVCWFFFLGVKSIQWQRIVHIFRNNPAVTHFTKSQSFRWLSLNVLCMPAVFMIVVPFVVINPIEWNKNSVFSSRFLFLPLCKRLCVMSTPNYCSTVSINCFAHVLFVSVSLSFSFLIYLRISLVRRTVCLLFMSFERLRIVHNYTVDITRDICKSKIQDSHGELKPFL